MNRVSGPSLTHRNHDNIRSSRVQTFKSDIAFFGKESKCLVNSKEQRVRNGSGDIDLLWAMIKQLIK